MKMRTSFLKVSTALGILVTHSRVGVVQGGIFDFGSSSQKKIKTPTDTTAWTPLREICTKARCRLSHQFESEGREDFAGYCYHCQGTTGDVCPLAQNVGEHFYGGKKDLLPLLLDNKFKTRVDPVTQDIVFDYKLAYLAKFDDPPDSLIRQCKIMNTSRGGKRVRLHYVMAFRYPVERRDYDNGKGFKMGLAVDQLAFPDASGGRIEWVTSDRVEAAFAKDKRIDSTGHHSQIGFVYFQDAIGVDQMLDSSRMLRAVIPKTRDALTTEEAEEFEMLRIMVKDPQELPRVCMYVFCTKGQAQGVDPSTLTTVQRAKWLTKELMHATGDLAEQTLGDGASVYDVNKKKRDMWQNIKGLVTGRLKGVLKEDAAQYSPECLKQANAWADALSKPTTTPAAAAAKPSVEDLLKKAIEKGAAKPTSQSETLGTLGG